MLKRFDMEYRNDRDIVNSSYINKDFQALWEELLELIPKLTNKWDPKNTNESDPLAVLIKLQAIFGDKLNYNIDKSILERFPQTLTEKRSAKNVYDTLGYNTPWYKAASATLTFTYIKQVEDIDSDPNREFDFTIPRFTMICDEDQSILFTVTDTTPLGYKVDDYQTSPDKYRYVQALQGRIHQYTINGVERITVDNLDKNNRLYFTESNVAQNGIFIDTLESFETSSKWQKVDNIYQALSPYTYEFGVDPVSGASYIEFPDSIANTIDNGLYIKYITTDGLNGNVKAKTVTKFFNEYTKLINSAGEELDNANNHITVTNSKAAMNGSDPAPIDEMYRNYQRVKNTFDTLVTLLDYENFLYRYEKPDGTNVVSNIRCSDRTNDLVDSYKLWTLTKSQELLKTKVAKGSDDSDKLDYNTIKIYPLNPISERGIENKAEFDKTFKFDSFLSGDDNSQANVDTFGRDDVIDETSTSLINIIDKQKVITTKIAEKPYGLITIPYDIKGDIYLNHKVSQYVANEVKNNVDNALYNALNSRELTIGQEPNYNDILNIIKNADDRIDYVALSPLSFDSSVNYPENVNDQLVKEKAIWAGNTRWADFNTDFTYRADQANPYSGNYGDSNTSVTIKSKIGLNNLGRNKFKLNKNENLVAYTPDYTAEKQFSNYLYYISTTPLQKNVPVKFNDGSYIYFYESAADAVSGSNCKYTLEKGDIVRSNFDISVNNTTGAAIPYLTPDKNIEQLKKIEGELVDKPGIAIQWITNSQGLVTAFNTTSSYTLKAGEYFIYKLVKEDAFTLFGEGNTLTAKRQITVSQTLQDKWFNQDWDSIINGEESLDGLWATESDGSQISYIQNKILIFGEDYEFKYSNNSSFSNWLGDGTVFDLYKNDSSLQYKLINDTNYQHFPSILPDDNWKGFLRLSYDINNITPFELLKDDSINYVTHTQQLSFKQGNDDSSIFAPTDTKSIYLQSNIDIESPGAIDLILSKNFFEVLDDSLKIYSYEKNPNVDSTPNSLFDKIKANTTWEAPGTSDQIIVFGAYADNAPSLLGHCSISDSNVNYFIAKGGNQYQVGDNDIEISQIQIADKTSKYFISNQTLGELLGDDSIEQLGEGELGDLEFNPTHNILANNLITNPTEPITFFKRNHPCNRYAIAKLRNLDELKVNSNSINQ